MHEQTAAHLLRLNREFYQSFALRFAETRRRLQPGVLRALELLPPQASLLDLGCGSGQLVRHLAELGHHGCYVGVDSSAELLEIAREGCPHPNARFQRADLADEAWADGLEPPFDQILAFAVLHHLPGSALRSRLLKRLRGMLGEDGRLRLSVWNFLASPRLRQRILPWEEIGLNEADVDAGDALLDWRHGGRGLRYVHHFTLPELEALALESGFRVQETYHSDGEGGKLGRYQVWSPAA